MKVSELTELLKVVPQDYEILRYQLDFPQSREEEITQLRTNHKSREVIIE
jgi:hypothetical protein